MSSLLLLMLTILVSLTNSHLLQSINVKYHPGGLSNLSLASVCDTMDQRMLILSYHIGKDWNKITKVQHCHGFNNLPNLDVSPLYRGVHELLVEIQKKHSKHGLIYTSYRIFILIAFITATIMNIFDCCLLNSILLRLSWMSYTFCIFHDRHHQGTLFGIKWIDYLLDIWDCIVAMPPKQWISQHQASHHLHTNSAQDVDVFSIYPVLRVLNHERFKVSTLHRFQWLYCFVLFSFVGLGFPLKNLGIGVKVFNESHKLIQAKEGSFIYFSMYMLLFIILPSYFCGLYALKMYLCTSAIGAVFIVLLFQISHHVSDVKHNNDLSSMKSYDTWLKSQVEESMSWGGYVSTVIFGGINFQIEHHVAPAIAPIYYYFAHDGLRRICKKYGIKYTYYNDFVDATYQYTKYIYDLNNDH